MVDKQTIIHMYRVGGHSKRGIAQDLGINRKTVHKVIAEYEASLSGPDPESSLESILITRPRYDTSSRRPRVIVGSLKELIDDCLRANARKRAAGLKKQCMRGIDIYELLVEKGYQVSYPSVCKYIAGAAAEQKDSARSQEAFIRGHYPAGESCEFDWGEVKLCLGGRQERLYMAVFTFSHSNGRYAWLFRHQDTQAFMESHRNFFRRVRGVPLLMVYDNMRVAVKKFVGAEKEPTDALLRLSTFYRYHYRFCNARSGWEKGHVERSVEYVRRKAFSVKDRFESLKETQIYLTQICDKINDKPGSISTADKKERLSADLAAIRPFFHEIGCFEISDYKVDKWSTVCVKSSHYSVPDTLVGQTVAVKAYSEKLVILHQGAKVAVHERMRFCGGWAVKLEHYLTTLLRKPGAVGGSLALKQMPQKIRQLFDKHFAANPKDFVLLLIYARDNDFTDDDIIQACRNLTSHGIRNISADQIKAMLHVGAEAHEPVELVSLPQIYADKSSGIEDGAMNILIELSQMMEMERNATTY